MLPRMSKILSPLLAAAFFLPLACGAASNDLEQEYAQVRKIALKDPKVQEAYQKANERLNDKILQIDPALKPIVEGAHLQQFHPAEHATKSRPHATVVVSKKVIHAVAAGETLGSIAAQYKVTVSALEKANHITDVRKLQVGQKLVIPAS